MRRHFRGSVWDLVCAAADGGKGGSPTKAPEVKTPEVKTSAAPLPSKPAAAKTVPDQPAPAAADADGHRHQRGRGHSEHGNGHGYGHDDDHHDDNGHHGGGGSCDSGKPKVSVAGVVVDEGGFALVTLSLSQATRHPVKLRYATVDGTAIAGLDYQATAGSVTIAPGQTAVTVRIPILADSLDEAAERFALRITKANGADIAVAEASITIRDDDAPVIAGPLAVTTNEDAAPLVVDLLDGVSDLNGDAPWVSGWGGLSRADGRPLAFSVEGARFRIDPAQFNDLAEGAREAVVLTYAVTDGSGTASRTLTLTVEGRNDAPTARDVSAMIGEDGPAGSFAFAAADPDRGAVLSYQILTPPAAGQVVLGADGRFLFDPAGAFESLQDGESREVSVVYRVVDEHGAGAQAVASILVVGANDAPAAQDDRSATLKDSARTILAADLLANDTDVEGDALALVAVAAGEGGSVALDADGNIRFIPESGFVGTASFSYTVSDGHGGFDSATVLVTVLTTSGNAAPIAVDDFLLGTDGDDVLTGGTGADTLVGGPGDDTLSGGAGNDTLLADSGDVVDGGQGNDTVVAVGDAPITLDMGASGIETVIGGQGDDSVTMGTGGAVYGGGGNDGVTTGLGNDTVRGGADDDTIRIVPGGADTVDGGAGSDTVQIPGAAGDYRFAFTPGGLTITQPGGSVVLSNVEVLDFGDLSVELDGAMRPSAFRVYEDVAVTIPKGLLLVNDHDPDGDPLTIVSVQEAANASVSLDANGDIRFLGLPDYNGLATFSYTISDGRGGFDTATVTVKVWPVNDAPVLGEDGPYTIAEDSALTLAVADLLANDTDVDGDALGLTQVGNGIGGVARLVDGTVTFIPEADYTGPAAFDVTVSDGHGGSVTRTVRVDVTPVNDAPLAESARFELSEDGPAQTLVLPVSDVDINDPLAVAILSQPAAGILVDNGDGTVSFDPAGQFEALGEGESRELNLHYRVSDAAGASVEADATIVVTGVNDAPDARNDASATMAGVARTIAVADLLANDTDVEGNALSLVAVGGAVGGTVGWDGGGEIVFTPTPGITGNARFTYTVGDGHGGTDTATVVVKVLPKDNLAPTAFDDFLLGGWQDDVLVADPTGSTLAGGLGADTLVGGTGNDTLIIDGGDLYSGGGGGDTVVIADPGGLAVDMAASGIETVIGGSGGDTVVVGTGGGVVLGGGGNDSVATGVGTDTVLAGGGDDTVTVIPGGADVIDGGAGTDTVQVAGAASAYQYVFTPGGLTLSQPGGSVSLSNVEILEFGDLTVELDAAMRPSAFRVYEDVAVTIPKGLLLANDVDPDGDPLSIVSVQDAANATIGLDGNGDIRFQGLPDYNGLATFTYTVTDGHGGVSTATVTVKVWPVNDAPVLGADNLVTAEDQALSITVAELLANDHDADGDPLTVTGVSNPTHGGVSLSNGMVTFTPTADFHGAASFDYTVSDGKGGSATRSVSVDVVSVNDAPVALPESLSTNRNTAVTILPSDLLANDSDPDGDGLTVAAVSNAVHGSVTQAPDGTITFTPDTGFVGNASFDTTVSDGNGGTATATTTIAVQGREVNSSLVVAPEVQVNTYTASDQSQPSVAVLDGGGHVVVWASYGQDGSGDGIYAQLYDAGGVKVGSETRINSSAADDQTAPSVAALAGGGYVVTWSSWGADGNAEGIITQRYDAAGRPLGGETRVNSYTNSYQVFPVVTGLADGGYVVTWSSFGQDGAGYGIYGQRYGADGIALGGEFRANTYTTGMQYLSAAAGLMGGGYVVTWQSTAQDGSGNGVYAQAYATDGARLGTEFQVNTSTGGEQALPSVAALADGGYVVSWQSSHEGVGNGIYAQIFNGDGSRRGGEFHVNSYALGEQINPAMVGTADGGFVVTWQSGGQDGSGHGIYGQRYHADGSVMGGEFRLNDYTPADQVTPAIAARSDGGFIAAWASNGQDGWGYAVESRIYAASHAAPMVTAIIGQLGQNQPVAAEALVVSGHVQGDAFVGAGYQQLARYEFRDDTASLGSGYFTLDGVAQASGSSIAVDASELDRLRWVAGSGLGTDNFQVRASDGSQWSDWASGSVRTVPLAGSLEASPEVQVNTYTASDQSQPSVAVLAGGGHVVVWASYGQDGSGDGIYAQLYDAGGVKVGSETRINSSAADDQTAPSVAALAGGGYVVTWSSWGADGNAEGIITQRYDAAGRPLGGETRVNSYTNSYQVFPVVTGLADGGYVVTWSSFGQDGAGYGIYGQRYGADGIALGGEFRANTYTTGMQYLSAAAGLMGGGYVVTWQSTAQDGSGNGVYAQAYATDGARLGTEFQVNTSTGGEQALPSVAALADGGYVVNWQSSHEGVGNGVYAQIFNGDGSRRGGEFHVNSYALGEQINPAVAGTADGSFVVTWQSGGQDGSGHGVYGQRYHADGSVMGGEFRLNDYTPADQVTPAIAARSDGGFIAAWASNGQDGWGYAVESKIYSSTVNPLGVDTGTSGADILFGSSGNDTLIGGAGADTYLAEAGHGADIIDNAGRVADGDKVLFGNGISIDQVWFQQAANDLKISIVGTNDSVTVAGWFTNSANHVATLQTDDGYTLADTAVQNLVAAMASLTPPPIGQISLTAGQHQQLDSVIAANWQPH